MTPPRFDSPTRTRSVSNVTVCSKTEGEADGEGVLDFWPDWVGALTGGGPLFCPSTRVGAGFGSTGEGPVAVASSAGGGSGNHPICLRNMSNPRMIPKDRMRKTTTRLSINKPLPRCEQYYCACYPGAFSAGRMSTRLKRRPITRACLPNASSRLIELLAHSEQLGATSQVAR